MRSLLTMCVPWGSGVFLVSLPSCVRRALLCWRHSIQQEPTNAQGRECDRGWLVGCMRLWVVGSKMQCVRQHRPSLIMVPSLLPLLLVLLPLSPPLLLLQVKICLDFGREGYNGQ